MPSSVLEHALAYASMGLSVIPLRPRPEPDPDGVAKRAMGAWKEFQNRRRTEDEVRACWGAHPTAGVAIICGAVSNVVGVDLDSDAAVAWAVEHLPATPVRTKSIKGEHWYYRHPGGPVGNKVKLALADGSHLDLDVRGDGGYLVAPPSIHPSGAAYEQLGEWTVPITSLPVYDAGWFAIAEPSVDDPTLGIMSTPPQGAESLMESDDGDESFIGRFLPPAPQATRTTAVTVPASFDGSAARQHQPDARRPDRLERARLYLSKCRPAVEGQAGDDHTYKTACVLVRDFALSEDEAYALMSGEWNDRCVPPWSPADLRKKVTSAGKSARGPVGAKLAEGGGRTGAHLRLVDGQTVADDGDDDQRPIIYVKAAELPRMVDEAVGALRADADLYQRGNQLVHVCTDQARAVRLLSRPPGEPSISTVGTHRLLELMARSARWVKRQVARDGGVDIVDVAPPDKVAKTMIERQGWPIRPLEGVIEAPTLRLDGTLLDTPGYDEATGLLFLGQALEAPIPDAPTRDDALQALQQLLEVVVDFPFAAEHHRAAAIAGLMTSVLRPAIPGHVPVFVCDASASRTGKGLLATVSSLIANGRDIPVVQPIGRDEQLRTAITSLALTGTRLVLWDEVQTLTGAVLQAAVTARIWADRQYHTQHMVQIPVSWVWWAAGNNVLVAGDMQDRVVPIRLEPMCERPGERTGWQHDPLEDWVLEHRQRLIRAILTIARAWVVSGRPDQKLKPFGGFMGWSRLIREALVWLGMEDPNIGREAIKEAAAEARGPIEGLLEAWRARHPEPIRIAGACNIARNEQGGELWPLLLELAANKARDDIDVDRLGKLFRQWKHKIFAGGLMLDGTRDRKGVTCWRVVVVETASVAPTAQQTPADPATSAPPPVVAAGGDTPVWPDHELQAAVGFWLGAAGAVSAELWAWLREHPMGPDAWAQAPWPGGQTYAEPWTEMARRTDAERRHLVDDAGNEVGARFVPTGNTLGSGRSWHWRELQPGAVDAWLQWLRNWRAP